MLIAEILSGGNCSFSKEEIKVFLHKDRIQALLHKVAHGKTEYHRELAAEKVLDLYQGGMNASFEDIVYVSDHVENPKIKVRAQKLIRANI